MDEKKKARETVEDTTMTGMGESPHQWHTDIADEEDEGPSSLPNGDVDFDTQSYHYSRSRHRRRRSSQYEETVTSTRSLYSNERDYVQENDRRYAGSYFMPNDEPEQVRLNIIHQAYLFVFSNRLTTVTLSTPSRILDIGTGTGEWAIEMGEAYPSAEIIGTDISAIQPSNVPSNVFFEIDDAEDECGWTYGENDFDLIHLRNMNGAFRDWNTIYSRALLHLKPGGHIEVVDFDDYHYLGAYFGEDSEMMRFIAAIVEAADKSGYPQIHAHLQAERLLDAGFEDVHLETFNIPLVGTGDEAGNSTARLWLVACSAGMEANALRLLTREMGWDAQRVRDMCEHLIEDLKSVVRDPVRGKGLAIKVDVLVGRKPSDGGLVP